MKELELGNYQKILYPLPSSFDLTKFSSIVSFRPVGFAYVLRLLEGTIGKRGEVESNWINIISGNKRNRVDENGQWS
jgi:hypothetical protein